jgi:hypothetical protein
LLLASPGMGIIMFFISFTPQSFISLCLFSWKFLWLAPGFFGKREMIVLTLEPSTP